MRSQVNSTGIDNVGNQTPVEIMDPGQDMNYPFEDLKKPPSPNEESVESGESSLEEDNSIYPEVRASVPPTDEEVPANTFRAWAIGIIWTIVLNGLDQFFQLHNPPLGLSSYLVILASLPSGKLAARFLPTRTWSVFGRSFTLNPGPFNRKEHTLIAIMAIGASSFDSGSVSSDVWTALIKKFGMDIPPGYRFLFLLTSQMLCFGMAGIFQKILVEPAYCIWPSVLPICSLIHSMHDGRFQNGVANGWKITRMNFFWIALACTTLYQFVPGYLFTGLTTFAWITWIAPNNVTLNQVFGATTGMDLLPLTLDWNTITAYSGSPLMVPTWAIVNILLGCVLFLWIISPALHWTNVWNGLYTPFSSSGTFDNTGKSYNVTRILNSDWTLNEAAYHAYSPIYLSTTSIISYGLGFAAVTSVLTHAYFYHGKAISEGLKGIVKNDNSVKNDDVHTRLMRRYKLVPSWWYAICFVIIFGLTILFVEYYDTGLPWWGIFLSVGINLVVLLPIGIMTATCNISVSTNILAAFIGGFIWPGKMVAVVIFKILTFNTTATAMYVVRDMKLGHYMKVPPRVVFAGQIVGFLTSWLVQTAVNIWALSNIEGICTSSATGGFTCPLASSYKTSIIFWGLIGPKKLFSTGAMYTPMLYFFLIGVAVPVIVYYAGKRWPKSPIRHLHMPLIFASTSAMPPATAGNFIPWAMIGLTFQWWIRKTFRPWWSKYNYLLAAALDAGLAITTFFIFFCLYYPNVNLNWWGNSIGDVTADGLGTPLKTVAAGEHYGPDTWL